MKEAINVAKLASELELDSPLFGLVLIIDNFEERDLKEVSSLLKRYKSDLPSVAFWVFSGWSNSELKSVQPVSEFEKIDERAKKIGLNHYNQALYFASQGNWELANSYLKKGGNLLATLNRDILINQANIHYLAGDKKAAISLLEQGLGFSNIHELPIIDRIRNFNLDEIISIDINNYLNFAN